MTCNFRPGKVESSLGRGNGGIGGIAGYQGDWGDRGIIKGYFFFTLANFILEPSLVREMGRGD